MIRLGFIYQYNMTKEDYSARLYAAVETYYSYNPDTLMPMLMVALALQGKLNVVTNHSDRSVSLCELNLKEIVRYDWVQLDRWQDFSSRPLRVLQMLLSSYAFSRDVKV